MDPSKTDNTIYNIYDTIALPCVWTASSGFSLLKALASLSVTSSTKSSYKINETLVLTVALLDSNGNLIPEAENQISAQVLSQDRALFLTGIQSSKPSNGYAKFTNLAVVGKLTSSVLTSSTLVQIQFSTISLDQSSQFSVLTQPFVVVGGNPRLLTVNLIVNSDSAPAPEFEAAVIAIDFYGNPATVPTGATASVSSVTSSVNDKALSMSKTTSPFVNSEASIVPTISPTEARTYLLCFTGLGLMVYENFTVFPGSASAIIVKYIDAEIVAWEPFRLDAAAIDVVGNIIYSMGTTVSLFVSLNTMQGIEVLSDNGQPGCSAPMTEGVAVFQNCAPSNVQASASGSFYPHHVQLLLSFCPTDLQPCPTPLSYTISITISPPVQNITTQVCIDQTLCERYYGTQDCPCTPIFENLQVANEEFFGTVIAQVYDSNGRTATGSSLMLSASLVSAADCVSLFGAVNQQVFDGKAVWLDLGARLLNNSDCNPKMSGLAGLKLSISVSHQEPNYVLYSNLVSYIPLHLDFPASYLKIDTIPTDTLTGVILFPPPILQLYAIMFSYPCWQTGLVDCVQPVLNTVRSAQVNIVPAGYTANTATEDNDLMMGTKSVPIINGMAIFTDLFITRVGTYKIFFTSSSEYANISSIGYINITVRVSQLHSISILQQPQSKEAFSPQNVSAILLDAYNNPLSCDIGECPSELSGYPAMVGSESWPTLTSADPLFTAQITPSDTCSSSVPNSSVPFGKAPSCSCKQGSIVQTRGVRGIGFFCSLTAASIGQFVLQISVGTLTVISNLFLISPGQPAALVVKALQSNTLVAGKPVSPPILVDFVDQCNNLATVENEVVVAGTQSDCAGLELSGTIKNMSVGSTVWLTDLQVKIVLPFKCQFTFESLGLTVLSSFFMVENSALSKLVVVQQPESALRGNVLFPPPVVNGYDEFGNLVVSSSVQYTITATLLSGDSIESSCSDYECNSTSVSGYCYKVFSWPSNWAVASSKCNAWGGSYASILSSQVNDFVVLLTQGPAWIGLSQGLNEISQYTGWTWADGSGSPPTPNSDQSGYSNWDNSTESGGGNCGAINVKSSGTWSILPCSTELPFVCHKPFSPTQSPAPQDSSCSCKNLGGENSQQLVSGKAVFANLEVTGDISALLRIVFSSIVGSSSVSVISETFIVKSNAVQLRVWRQPGSGAANQPLVTQPLVLLVDSFGNVVTSEVRTCSAQLIGQGSGVLLGDVNVSSKEGLCEFEKLFVKKAQIAAYTLRFTSGNYLSVDSLPFIVSGGAESLRILADIQVQLLAGDSIPPITVLMLNSNGVAKWASCEDGDQSVKTSCLVVSCNDVITVSLVGSIRNDSLVGKVSASCANGATAFTDLSIFEAYGTYHLTFHSHYTNLSVSTNSFTVLPQEYATVIFSKQPNNIRAGDRVEVVAGLVDMYMNRVFNSNVTIVAELLAFYGNVPFSESLCYSKYGSCNFYFQINVSGIYYVRLTLTTNASACRLLNSSEAKLCSLRSQSLVDSNSFVVDSNDPASITISRNISAVTKAGLAFEIQPICEIRDIFDNLVSKSFNVQAVVQNSAGGCLCDFTKNGKCTSSLPSNSIQECAGLCPAAKFSKAPNVSTIGGVAAFENLACTKASCIPACLPPTCGANNCNQSYRFSCTVWGGLCSPCTAHSNFFDVVPNEVSAIDPGPIQISIAGSPARGVPDAGFFKTASASAVASGIVTSGANFSISSLTR